MTPSVSAAQNPWPSYGASFEKPASPGPQTEDEVPSSHLTSFEHKESHSPDLSENGIDDSTKKATEQYAKATGSGIHRDWVNDSLDVETAVKKMKKNLVKAAKEHDAHFFKEVVKKKYPHVMIKRNPFRPIRSLQPSAQVAPTQELRCDEIGSHCIQGQRSSMDDVHFSMRMPHALLLGVFDGHRVCGGEKTDQVSGQAVANFASTKFQELFPASIAEFQDPRYGDNIHQALEKTCARIQAEIVTHKEFDYIGSTAVICYLDFSTGFIYTATVGDSEAYFYNTNERRLIPLSGVKNWAGKRDIWRITIATKGEYTEPITKTWQRLMISPKHRRVQPKVEGITKNNLKGTNVSRCFGDQANNIGRLVDAVIAKPTITICDLQPGVIVLTCDGFTDYVDELQTISDIEHSIKHKYSAERMSRKLVELAVNNETKDNVTAVVGKIGA